MYRYRYQWPADWLRLMVEFEDRKRSSHPGECLQVTLQWSMMSLYKSVKGRDIKSAFERNSISHGVEVSSSGQITLREKALCRIFEPVTASVVGQIVEFVTKYLISNSNICLVLVGGFSQSEFLRMAVRSQFSNSFTSVLTPEEPQLAVLKGAVLLGQCSNSC